MIEFLAILFVTWLLMGIISRIPNRVLLMLQLLPIAALTAIGWELRGPLGWIAAGFSAFFLIAIICKLVEDADIKAAKVAAEAAKRVVTSAVVLRLVK